MYELKLRIWLERDGRFIVSEGRAELLKKVKETGSLSEAAKQMGMSYRHAWGIVHRISQSAGGDIVRSVRGGKSGGVSVLTPFGEEVLREYESKATALRNLMEKQWKRPSVTADGIVARGNDVVLVKRRNEPFKGMHALPGGFMNYGETFEHCAIREVEEETGLKTEVLGLVGVYSDPDRDPRGHTVSAVFHMRPTGGALGGGDDAETAEWIPLDDLPKLAFDHGRILEDFLAQRKQRKGK